MTIVSNNQKRKVMKKFVLALMITGTVPLITDPTCFKIVIPFQFTKTLAEK